jgi:carbon monoxide dehydrogenase subunit G
MGASLRLRTRLFAVAVLTFSVAQPAFAGSELTEGESVALESGRPVVREENIERAGHHYIGGVSYIVIDATPERVAAVLDDVQAYRQILPHIRSVRWIGLTRKGDALVEIEQGNAIAHGKYTVRVRHERGGADSSSATIRFWLDRRFSHDVDDANGFFHLEPWGQKTLLTYLVMADLGPGIFSRLFEGRIRRAALSTPTLVKTYVESHRPT